MCSPNSQTPTFHLRWSKRLEVTALTLFFACIGVQVSAQQITYNSGSTGADGAFSPTQSQQVQLPESGVFNFTTVNIPPNVTINFKRNSKNTPVTILASGNVTIAGPIILDGSPGFPSNTIGSSTGGGTGGPGGFDGGRGGTQFSGFTAALSGSGPGAGGGGSSADGTNIGGGGGAGFVNAGEDGGKENANSIFGKGGLRYGSTTLVPLIGGSGGGGGGGGTTQLGVGGGGGGGAILIASSGTVTFTNAIIYSQGGAGNNYCSSGNGGGGAGGAVRIAATTLSGNLTVYVAGGSGINSCAVAQGGKGSGGAVRLEAYNFSNFTPSVSGAASNVLSKSPNPPKQASPPQLSITSVAGITPPASPSGLYDAPDIVLPGNQSNPVTAVISASNIPLNTAVQVIMMPEVGAQTVFQSTPLSGTLASSTATASLNLPGGTSLITATVVIDLTAKNSGPPMFINGERVDRIEVAATFGGKSAVTYVTHSGLRVKHPSE